jgi:GGDEF domain-containing protein
VPPAPNIRLYVILWVASISSALFSLAGTLQYAQAGLESFGLQMLILAAWAIGCSRFFSRAPEHATGGYLLGKLLILIAFARVVAPGWAGTDIGGIAYAVFSLPLILGMVLVWGWAGALLGAAATVLLTWLSLDFGVVQGLTVAFMLLSSIVGGMLLYVYLVDLEAAKRQLEQSASTDLLTRTGNRRALVEDFLRYQSLARQQGVPLLLMSWDLDGLKRVNDKEGHAAGDQYILNFVEALRAAVRQGDSIYRVGGDEFVTLHIGLSSGGVLYERVRNQFTHVSGGWVRCANLTFDQVLTDADQMMYAEKRRHKEKVTRIIGETAGSRA